MWTTINRKAKKNKVEEQVLAGDGWEYVNKHDRRKNDSVVNSGGGENMAKPQRELRGEYRVHNSDSSGRYRGGNSDSGWGFRGGRGGGESAGRGTLQRRNSFKTHRSGVQHAGNSGVSNISPSLGSRGGVGCWFSPPPARRIAFQPPRGTPSSAPSPQPVHISLNTWAAKTSTSQAPEPAVPMPVEPTEAVKPAVPQPAQQLLKYSWAIITNSSQASMDASEEPSHSTFEEEKVEKDGKKHYDRDFLMKLKTNPLSLQKPETLPANMQVILNIPALKNLNPIASAPNMMNRAFAMNPQNIIRSPKTHSRTSR